MRCRLHWDCTGILEAGQPCGHHGWHAGNGDCGASCNGNCECLTAAELDPWEPDDLGPAADPWPWGRTENDPQWQGRVQL